jgi:hypothetical protein
VSLVLYLVAVLNEAVQDAHRLGLSTDLAAWYTRMIAWTRRPEVPAEQAYREHPRLRSPHVFAVPRTE